MNFNPGDFDPFMNSHIKSGFHNLKFEDFQRFMMELFRKNGYQVRQLAKTEEVGSDLLIEKEGISTAVQIFKYPAERKVDVQEVHLAMSSANHHKADQAMIVTTSSFTAPARTLSDRAGIFTWTGDVLQEAILKTFPGDLQPEFDVSSDSPVEDDEFFTIHVLEVSPDQYLPEDHQPITKVVLELSNNSGRNLHLFLNLPILIRHDKKQYSASNWMESSFTSGMVYKDAKVELIFYFPESQLNDLHQNDQILVPVTVPSLSLQKTYSTHLMPADGRCFVVTYAFSKFSPAYWEAIRFRDEVLMRSRWGRRSVALYYRWSPEWIRYFEDRHYMRPIVRRTIFFILKLIEGMRKIGGFFVMKKEHNEK